MCKVYRFGGLVWSHWKVAVSNFGFWVKMAGSSLIAFLILWQISGRSVPWWVYAAIAVLTLLVSCFMAWNAEFSARVKAEEALAGAISQNLRADLRAEQLLVDEKANKLTVDEIVLKAARSGFRNLVKGQHAIVAPRTYLNEKWVQLIAETHGRSVGEINEAIDRLDGKFHWQS